MNENPIIECFDSLREARSAARKRGDEQEGLSAYLDLVTRTFDCLMQQPKEQLKKFAVGLNSSQMAFVRGISTSGAIWAVRRKSREWLVLGLKGLLDEDLTNDPRETITQLAL